MPLFLLLFILLFLPSCSTCPANVADMTYTAPESKKVASSSKYYHNIIVDKVSGGSPTSSYGDVKVGNPQFKLAIERSLKSANMLATSQKATYHLTAEIVNFEQQSFGNSPKTTIKVKFTLLNKKTNVNTFSDTYENDDCADNKDAFRRGKKVEIATEKAVRGTIQKLLDRLLM